ncbi:MAG: NUDIX hydrolase [Verrucomicrobiae bacterium]|nr:NUDIX hydrolase [Verrucomicrobiae bacterium]
MIQSWPLIESTHLGDFRVFKVRRDRKTSPRTGATHDLYVLDCPDWVNVVAVTPENELVLIEQYRHGSNTVELEIPGGVIDTSDASPIAAGLRELREETGFEGHNARVLSCILPNPAIITNRCYTILVENCVKTHPVSFDQGEDIITRLVPWKEIPRAVASGQIRHSLVIVALYQFDLWLRNYHASGNSGGIV